MAVAARDAASAALATDSRLLKHGTPLVDASNYPLWPNGTPTWAVQEWDVIKATLIKLDSEWLVWTNWYEARLFGANPNSDLELARATIADEIWDAGARRVNSEILALEEQYRDPQPIPNLPAPLSFEWTEAGQFAIAAHPATLPLFPFRKSEKDHAHRLAASRTLGSDLIDDLRKQRFQARLEYRECLERYVKRLPDDSEPGNILLADAEARALRHLFAAEASDLSPAFASKLRVFLEHHIGLRAFYPEIESFYRDVQTGHISAPLPLDAVRGLIDGIVANTPTVFDHSVSVGLTAISSSQRITIEVKHPDSAGRDLNTISPPPDPFGTIDENRARDASLAEASNELWKVFLLGEKVAKAVDAWKHVSATLRPYVAEIITWLRAFLGF